MRSNDIWSSDFPTRRHDGWKALIVFLAFAAGIGVRTLIERGWL